MRFADLFESDYTEDLRSEIITLLTAVSAEGIDEVDTTNLLNDLQNQGFAVDEAILMDLLSTIEIVSIATSDKITIATSDADAMVGDEAGNVEVDKVDNMATAQATKDIGEEINATNSGEDVIVVAPGHKHEGDTGVVMKVDETGILVNLYNHGPVWFSSDELDVNDYADSDEEEMDQRGMMGDDEYDRADNNYDESLDRIRTLAGTNKG